MSEKITKSLIYKTLSGIKHPDFPDHDLVALGMIPEVDIEAEQISILFVLPSLGNPGNQSLVDTVQKVIEGVAGGLLVKIKVKKMKGEQLRQFSALTGGKKIKTVIAVMSGKGGVGKSSITGLLASALERQGNRIGILDADITGPSIPMMFGANQMPASGPNGILPVNSSTGIKLMSVNLLLSDTEQPVVWRGPLIGRAIQQFWDEIEWGELDFLIVDLPPGTADASLTVMQSLPLDGILLVTSPQDLAGMIVRKAANMAKQLEIPLIGLVENMSFVECPKCGEKIFVFGKSQAENSAKKIGIPILGQIPLDTHLSVLCDYGSIEDYRSVEVDSITDQVIEFISPAEKLPSVSISAT
jgi:Mrp family chromosome partitioning ATPase